MHAITGSEARDIELLEQVMRAQHPPLILGGDIIREMEKTWRKWDPAFIANALNIGPTLGAKIFHEWQEAHERRYTLP